MSQRRSVLRSVSRPISTVGASGSGVPLNSSTAASIAGARALSRRASRAAPFRSSAADKARTVSGCGRRRWPRSRALTAWTEWPAMVASSSCVHPAVSRSAFRCAPNDPGAPIFKTLILLLRLEEILPPPLYEHCPGFVPPLSVVEIERRRPHWTHDGPQKSHGIRAILCLRRGVSSLLDCMAICRLPKDHSSWQLNSCVRAREHQLPPPVVGCACCPLLAASGS